MLHVALIWIMLKKSTNYRLLQLSYGYNSRLFLQNTLNSFGSDERMITMDECYHLAAKAMQILSKLSKFDSGTKQHYVTSMVLMF